MNDRFLTLLIAAVVVVTIGSLLYRAQSIEPLPKGLQTDTMETDAGLAISTQVVAVMTDCNRDGGDRIVGRGLIRNIGNVDLHYVTVKVLWMNSVGLLAEANETYALNDEILPPGAEKVFIDVTKSPTAVRCNVETVDWW
jgi:hypothetical protein